MPGEGTSMPNKDNFFEDGFELLHKVFNTAIREDQQVDLLLISPLTDIVRYAELHPEIFRDAAGKAFMQGGYFLSAAGTTPQLYIL